jgi:hypothetical protein
MLDKPWLSYFFRRIVEANHNRQLSSTCDSPMRCNQIHPQASNQFLAVQLPILDELDIFQCESGDWGVAPCILILVVGWILGQGSICEVKKSPNEKLWAMDTMNIMTAGKRKSS